MLPKRKKASIIDYKCDKLLAVDKKLIQAIHLPMLCILYQYKYYFPIIENLILPKKFNCVLKMQKVSVGLKTLKKIKKYQYL